MKYLLDTHTFLWWITDDPSLSENARDIIGNGNNELYLSSASGWEIAIKTGLGRLRLDDDPEIFIPDQLRVNSILALPVLLNHGLHVYRLPLLHRDPFDRMLVAQGQMEKMGIVTDDPLIKKYDVETAW